MKATATAAEIAKAVGSGKASARSVVLAALERIDRHNHRLGAFTEMVAERALAKADAVDEAIVGGAKGGPLAGVPFAAKNLYDVEGLVTRAGSKINRDNPPAAADAMIVRKLEAAGAILVGVTNMDEYAYGFVGDNAHDGPSHNPHDLERITGGSSAGTASALAAGLVPLALGSDTNGSIRVPASLCGLFGLKPTYGRLSRSGAYPFVGSLDHVGPLGRSARDLALAYDAMQGTDDSDPAQAKRPVEPTDSRLRHPIPGVRIGIAAGYFAGEGDAQVAVAIVAAALQTTRQVAIPDAQAARAAAFVITMAEGAALHLDRLRERPLDYDPAVRDRLLAGTMLPAVWVQQAQKLRRHFRDNVMRVFDQVDAIITPATPLVAPKIGQQTARFGGVDMPIRPNLGLFTQPFSFIGVPAASVPIWLENQPLPIGVQIVAPPWREDICLRIAHQLEQAGIAKAPVAQGFGDD